MQFLWPKRGRNAARRLPPARQPAGLVFCASCTGAMTLRTGTSRTGIVRRYYSCPVSLRWG